MTLEQLNTLLEGTLTELGVSGLNDMQSALIARVKQGGDAVILTDRSNDPGTGISYVSVMKAPKAFEGSPRVLVLSPTIDSVHVLHKQLTDWTRRTEIAVELGHDKGNMIQERNNIFEGADIIVGNPKRIMDLYHQNGIHINQLNLFIVDDAAEIANNPNAAAYISRLAESLPKCQRIVITSEITPRVEKMIELLCMNPKVMEFETPEA
ncbi:MAG TPA: DEAD/DEAH box helicase family protein [Fluviicola sp.]|nr:DEAD/DEAH box helicase family protein [Fluviicola sp.]